MIETVSSATTPLTEEFRHWIRAVAELTSDGELFSIAELPETGPGQHSPAS